MADQPTGFRVPRRGELLELRIERIDGDGRGLADLELQLGPQRTSRRLTVAVRKALPGDRVRVRVEGRRRQRLEAGIVELLEPAPERIPPRCPHFGRREEPGRGCGGCTLQSLPYAEQLRLKGDRVAAALAPAGVAAERVGRVIGQADPWYYRNKMEFSFAAARDGSLALGLYPTGFRREVLALEDCFLLSPAAAPLLGAVRDWAARQGLQAYRHRDDSGWLRTLTLREGKRTGQRMAILTTAAADPVETDQGPQPAAELADDFARAIQRAAGGPGQALDAVHWIEQRLARGTPTRFVEHRLAGGAVLEEELLLPGGQRLRFAIHPRAFFQPNSLQAEVLYREVLAAAALDGQGGAKQAVDLYCGTGTIALCLAPFFQRVVGVELSSAAVADARHNAERNGLHNVAFVVGDAGQALAAGLALDRDRLALAVVDPPRSGLSPDALRHLVALGAPGVVYVSCNPEALGRDLVALQAAGYRLRSVQPVDMFPHTPHVETVVRLDR